MPTQQSGTNWSVIIAGIALFLTIANSVLGALIGGTDKLDKRVAQIESDLAWKYVSKELAAKDIGFITLMINELKIGKVEKDVYDQKFITIDRILTLQRERITELERQLTVARQEHRLEPH